MVNSIVDGLSRHNNVLLYKVLNQLGVLGFDQKAVQQHKGDSGPPEFLFCTVEWQTEPEELTADSYRRASL